ncbi:Peroxisome biogenesis protein 6 [Morella rubra]|uniref:Peroxisomal ATPase PEX6 n=1 Tax=Morella rubra TaxID=262757 RepID=A0A6A1UTA6_9ROSI|nr:Peroxisome biogenesis protein 6 [Morella rubra]
MVERRKPLLLASTKLLVNTVLSSSRLSEGDRDRIVAVTGEKVPDDIVCGDLQQRVGILRFPRDEDVISERILASLDDAALVGLSTSTLKQLSITSGSLVKMNFSQKICLRDNVLVKNVETNVQRVAQAVVLDPPGTYTGFKLTSYHTMLVFPSVTFSQNGCLQLGGEVAYLSPILAFNLDLHISCLKSLVQGGQKNLASYFQVKVDDKTCGEAIEGAVISVGLEPVAQLPRYASHLRASFVKIPECGTLKSLKGISPIEAEDRQDMIDLALQNYFKADRYLARGDIFRICINWKCNSITCIPCNQKSENRSENIIYFKVVAMEPSDEQVLRVNSTQTALVLGGSVPSAIPPDLLIHGPTGFAPLQQDTVKTLASVLTPPLCPSALSSKFRVSVLLYGLAGCGKRTVVNYVARRLGLHVVEYSCFNLLASSERKASAALAQAFKTAQSYLPTILLLRHFDVFRDLGTREGSSNDQVGITTEVASVVRKFTEPVSEDEDIDSKGEPNDDFHVRDAGKMSRHQVLLVAAADSSEGLPPTLRRCFSHEIGMGPLTEEQRIEMLSQLLQSVSKLLPNVGSEDFIKEISGQTSGFMPRDIRALIADAGANLIPRVDVPLPKVEPKKVDMNSCEAVPQVLGKEDLTKAMERSKKRNASALGTPKVPNVKWEDVGGLEDVKKSILDTVQLPLLHKDLFSSGLRKRSGVLLYGPPGTGKTLLAKAVATECSLNFLSVKGPELINMYIGESEKNIRDVFQKARSARPCVIFFDELDSLAPARGASGDSGGVMDRVVSQMLAEIDGLSDSTQDLFIIGASNRPDLIDPALLRPGRFDKLLYVGVNSDASYRERVLKALTRKFKLHPDISLYSIAKKCPPNFTGADMYALCADAWFHAAKRKVLNVDSDSSPVDDKGDAVVVDYDDFVKVLEELSPSLSMAELKRYESLRAQFEGAPK